MKHKVTITREMVEEAIGKQPMLLSMPPKIKFPDSFEVEVEIPDEVIIEHLGDALNQVGEIIHGGFLNRNRNKS